MQIFDQKQRQNAQRSFLWQLARRLGAACSLELSDSITHAVTLASQTDKSLAAKKQGALVVHPDWLLTCETR
jgi:BRCA1 C Terminus (BRCT) domain